MSTFNIDFVRKNSEIIQYADLALDHINDHDYEISEESVRECIFYIPMLKAILVDMNRNPASTLEEKVLIEDAITFMERVLKIYTKHK